MAGNAVDRIGHHRRADSAPDGDVSCFWLWLFRRTLAAGRVNWWLHTLALLVFLPLIPHTKHLHLLLSPVTIFLIARQFQRISRRW